MLARLDAYMEATRRTSEFDLERNPHLEPYIQPKIDALADPGTAAAVRQGPNAVLRELPTSAGGVIPLVVLYMEDGMQAEAEQAAMVLAEAFPLLGSFMGAPFPASGVQVWYGFKVGAANAGNIDIEDRATYERRSADGFGGIPYEPMLAHELAHFFVGHETLTQFVELYLHNVRVVHSTSLSAWTYTRDHADAGQPHADLAALVDVYAMLGAGAMAAAYQGLYAAGRLPAYGQPMTSEARQAFVDQAPAGSTDRVAELMARVA